MDPADLSQRLIEVARRVLQLENQRDAIEAQLSEAKKEHLDLVLAASRPTASKVPEVPHTRAGAQILAEVTEGANSGDLSVRQRILRFVAKRAPVEQSAVETALAGFGEKTVRQALYDMTSVKSGTLERGPLGLTLTQKGQEALKST